jgi:carbon-monoxide dehydrogenase medium subunit
VAAVGGVQENPGQVKKSMLLPKFQYHEPSTLEEACQIMAELKERARPLAGGTDLLVNMKKGLISPKHVISLRMIEALREKDFSKETLRIGACVTAADLAESGQIRETLSGLCKGAASLGSPLIRNQATVAGNLVTARPAADLPPSLMAYGADVMLKSNKGERSIPLKDFFKGPGQTLIGVDEILTKISIEAPPPNSGAGYIKLGVRKALEISLVNVAAFMALDDQDSTIKTARLVLGAVAPVPMRAHSAERILLGEKPTEALFSRAGEAAAKDARPIDDFRASAEYRKAMVEILTKRVLDAAYKEARAS